MADTTPTLRAALAAEQAEPPLPEYGATDFGFTFAGIELEEGDKRLMRLLVTALGTDHPAITDMVALLFRARKPAPAAEQAEPVAGFRLLPSRLTNEMRAAMADAARAYMARTGGNSADAMYDAAVAAAPPAPAPTWPEWAEQILKIVREYSGYDGYDDADGVDLPEEVREALEELTAQITRLEAKAPAPAAAPAGEPAACISRTQGRIYAQLLPAGRSLPLGTSLYPQQSAAMFQPAPARQEPLTSEQVKSIVRDAGYDHAPAQHRADFINGMRHAERAHGITAAPAEGGA